MKSISIRYLSGPDIAALELGNDEILAAIELCLRAQGEGACVIEPRMHLVPDESFNGHFNVLRGYLGAIVLSFAHTLGEFGVVLMVGGNIPGETRVISIAIYDQVESLNYAAAHQLSATLLVFAFIALLAMFIVNRRWHAQ